MSWLIFKNWCCRAWLWTKEHWQIPFLLAWSILIYILSRRNTDALVDVIDAKKDSYKKQAEVLKSSHNDEIIKRDNLTDKFLDTLDVVDENFKKQEKELTDKHREQVKDLVVKSKGNSDQIRKKIEEEFGFKYVE